jgi:hypothetical protein
LAKNNGFRPESRKKPYFSTKIGKKDGHCTGKAGNRQTGGEINEQWKMKNEK